ncbi:Wsc domain [Mycena venus]|uniref:Wsc domain n=1 Tax=Mycena venus TaxID=2733690 RepID=A0A8H7CEU3_9AGAR|nr:Wsc domain [Mycena venus]
MLRSSFGVLVSLLGLVGVANTWFRVPCTDTLVQERPAYSYDNLPPNTTHEYSNIHGYPQDLSNYWFPKLYFQDPKTQLFEPVGNGGLLVYYQNRGDGDTSNGGAGLKICYLTFTIRRRGQCDPKRRSKKFAIGLGTQRNCANELFNGLACAIPLVSLDTLFFEVKWNVADFSGPWNPSVDKWPFVYSTGWDTTDLQNAIYQCNNPNDQTGQGITEACRFLTVKPAALSNQC